MGKLSNYLFRPFILKKKKKEIKKRFPDSNISPKVLYSTDTKIEGKAIIREGANVIYSEIGFGSLVGNSSLYNVKIGRFCSISSSVYISPYIHPSQFVSTNVSFYNTSNQGVPFGKAKTEFNEVLCTENGRFAEIGNDVWIGQNVLIKGGVKIGDGAIVGMGAVVTKDVPPYAVVGGVPAKIIKYRFPENIVKELLKIKWWDWPIDKIDAVRDEFADVEKFVEKYKVKGEN